MKDDQVSNASASTAVMAMKEEKKTSSKDCGRECRCEENSVFHDKGGRERFVGQHLVPKGTVVHRFNRLTDEEHKYEKNLMSKEDERCDFDNRSRPRLSRFQVVSLKSEDGDRNLWDRILRPWAEHPKVRPSLILPSNHHTRFLLPTVERPLSLQSS
jgi:hypothetical protein